ncbi:hypothetical protein MRX96_048560 [Rhipicephalus microplus]
MQPASLERNEARQRRLTLLNDASQLRARLPAMPRSHNRVIVRPGGGLNVQACSPHRILAALTMAAQLAPSHPARFLPRPPNRKDLL